MREILLLFFLMFYYAVSAQTFYVAPYGDDDAGDGSYANPWNSIGKVFDEIEERNIVHGDTVFFRGGVYKLPNGTTSLDGSGLSAKVEDTLKLWNYPGERPIFDRNHDRTSGTHGVAIGGYTSYFHIKGITIRNIWQIQDGSEVFAFAFAAKNGLIENCIVYNVHGEGFVTLNASTELKFLNCDAFNCIDSLSGMNGEPDSAQPGNDGSGFRIGSSKTDTNSSEKQRIYYEGCRAWNCSDQGWSNSSYGYTEHKNCYAFFNGALTGTGTGFKNGYKADLLPRPLEPNQYFKNCVTAFNRTYGFSSNDQDRYANGVFIYNSIGYKNGYKTNSGTDGVGFQVFNSLEGNTTEERLRQYYNNISYDNLSHAYRERTGTTATHTNNSWDIDGISVTDNDFVSVDTTGMLAPRQADGSLPNNNFYNNFMRLTTGSDLIDAGKDVGLSFNGKAPDLGPYESDVDLNDNFYPDIKIISPNSNTIFGVSANIIINLDAKDNDGSVSKVELYNGPIKIGELTSTPWKYTWNDLPEGKYDIRAVAYDNKGAKATTDITSIKVIPNSKPFVTISSPSTGAEYSIPSTIEILANASDSDGTISKVEFYNGEKKIGEKTKSPWISNFYVDQSGSYTLKAIATDNMGGSTSSSPVTIEVKNYKPTVSLITPSPNEVFHAPASITITADPNDVDGSISKVEFYNGNSKLGEKLSPPWSYSWKNVALGEYSIKAVAYDNLSAKASSGVVNISVVNDKPSVSIITPDPGQVFHAPASIEISADAQDSDGSITKVEFFNGTEKLGDKLSSPWTLSLDNVGLGNYNIKAIATDNLGASSESQSISIQVINDKPVINLVSPLNTRDYIAPASIVISAEATDNDGSISLVEFFNGSEKLGEKTSSPWSFKWENVQAGMYTITATATDNLGASSSTIPFEVVVKNNSLPTVSLSSPVNGATFGASPSIVLTAEAQDYDGTISRVEFYEGEFKLGESLKEPWSFTWNNPDIGIYYLKAVAYDDHNDSSSSTPIMVKVKNNSPSVSMLAPTEKEFSAPATIDLTAGASDTDGTIRKVEFYNGYEKLGEIYSKPYTLKWEEVPSGDYVVTAVATDDLDGKSTSFPVAIKVIPDIKLFPNPNNGIFTLTISDPIEGNSARIIIKSIEGKIIHEEYLREGELIKQFNFSNIQSGTYILTVIGEDIHITRNFVKSGY